MSIKTRLHNLSRLESTRNETPLWTDEQLLAIDAAQRAVQRHCLCTICTKQNSCDSNGPEDILNPACFELSTKPL